MPSILVVPLVKQGLTRHIGTNVRALDAVWRSIGNATTCTAKKVRDPYVKDHFGAVRCRYRVSVKGERSGF